MLIGNLLPGRRRLWWLPLLLVTSALVTSVPRPAGAGSPPPLKATGFLAVTTGSGSSQIASFKLDGSGMTQLTSGPANHYGPSLSQDGKHILFSGEDGGALEVYVMNADGSGVTPITKPPASAGTASWSPDGSAIVYAALLGGRYQIFRAAPDGSNPVQITRDPKASSASPVFSPDGSTIAYSATTVDTSGGGAVPVSRIWVMNGRDGSGAKQLSSGTADAYPAWIDNSALLFARTSNQGKASQIFSINLAGVEKPQSPPDRFITEPKPLPDGLSYGATILNGTSFGLVIVARSDGGGLALRPGGIVLVATTTDAGFLLTPIVISAGDAFTIAWILAPAPVATAVPSSVPGVAVRTPASSSPPGLLLPLAVAVTVVVGVIVLILLRRPPRREQVRPGKFRSRQRS